MLKIHNLYISKVHNLVEDKVESLKISLKVRKIENQSHQTG